MNRPLKVAIVGCGKIADGHVEEVRKMPELGRVVAVCDLELLMAEQLAVRYAIPRHYDDMGRMIAAERPDVVHITTPPAAHFALATAAMDAGCHVYVEKPLTMNHADSKRLVEHAERAERKLTIGYTYLFDPPALTMRRLIAEGALGEPVHVESFYGYHLGGQFGSALLSDASHWVHRLPGKLFHNNIDHLLNKLLEFVPDESPSITATSFARRTQRFGDARDDMHDELRLLVRGRGVTAYGTFSSTIQPVMHFCRVYGTKGTAHVDYVSRTVTLECEPRLPSAIGRLLPAFERAAGFAKEGVRNVVRFARSDFHFFSGLNHLISSYYRSILEEGPPPISHRDILRVSAMLDEVFAQLASRPPAADGA